MKFFFCFLSKRVALFDLPRFFFLFFLLKQDSFSRRFSSNKLYGKGYSNLYRATENDEPSEDLFFLIAAECVEQQI